MQQPIHYFALLIPLKLSVAFPSLGLTVSSVLPATRSSPPDPSKSRDDDGDDDDVNDDGVVSAGLAGDKLVLN